jgi:hypothetical protein
MQSNTPDPVVREFAKKRLKTLFVLTTIFSSIIFIYAMMSLVFWMKSNILWENGGDEQKLVLDLLKSIFGNTIVRQVLENNEFGMITSALINYYLLIAVSCVLAVAGALMMWREKRNGLYIYVAGYIVYLGSGFLGLGQYYSMHIELLISLLVGVIFISLYNQALKKL